ncbi:hypothetical protein [Dyadobacter subterraneus]
MHYRLNVFPIHLLALAERKAGIALLVDHFIKDYGYKTARKRSGLSRKELNNLFEYNRPGNIFELKNVVERNLLLAKGLLLKIPFTYTAPLGLNFNYRRSRLANPISTVMFLLSGRLINYHCVWAAVTEFF